MQVYQIDQAEELEQQAILRENARREHAEERATERAARKAARKGGSAAESGLPLRQPAAEQAGDKQPSGGGSTNDDSGTPRSDGPKPAGASPPEVVAAATGSSSGWGRWFGRWCGWCARPHASLRSVNAHLSARRLLKRERRLQRPAYQQYLAHEIDKYCMVVLLLAYVIAGRPLWAARGGWAGGTAGRAHVAHASQPWLHPPVMQPRTCSTLPPLPSLPACSRPDLRSAARMCVGPAGCLGRGRVLE